MSLIRTSSLSTHSLETATIWRAYQRKVFCQAKRTECLPICFNCKQSDERWFAKQLGQRHERERKGKKKDMKRAMLRMPEKIQPFCRAMPLFFSFASAAARRQKSRPNWAFQLHLNISWLTIFSFFKCQVNSSALFQLDCLVISCACQDPYSNSCPKG